MVLKRGKVSILASSHQKQKTSKVTITLRKKSRGKLATKKSASWADSSCDPLSILNRLNKFFELFLDDGLNSEFAYLFGLKNV